MSVSRELWVVRQGTEEPELVVDGAVSDTGILGLYANVCGRESSAWLMHMVGQLPEWWQLVDLVRVANLSDTLDEEFQPEQDAQSLWEIATVQERIRLQRGWRVNQGKYGNQIRQVNKDFGRISPVPVNGLEVEVIEAPMESKLILPERRLIRV